MRRIILVSMFLFASISLGNDGSGYMAMTGTVHLSKSPHPSIRLVDESIIVKLPERKVKVEFTFHNEGKATDAVMIFPENGYPGAILGYNRHRRSQFGYFRSYVDGRRAKLYFTKLPANPDYAAGGLIYHNWWAKRVHFRAGQWRKIVNEYQGGYSNGPAGTAYQGFEYVLRTGKTWKGGRIGHTRVIVDARKVLREGGMQFQPAGWRESGGFCAWERWNYVPNDNLDLSWYLGFTKFSIDGRLGSQAIANIAWGLETPMPERVGGEVYLQLLQASKGLRASVLLHPLRLRRGQSVVELSSLPKARFEKGRWMIPLRATALALGGSSVWRNGWLWVDMPKLPYKDEE